MLRSLSDHLTNICVKSKGVTISTEKLTNRHKKTTWTWNGTVTTKTQNTQNKKKNQNWIKWITILWLYFIASALELNLFCTRIVSANKTKQKKCQHKQYCNRKPWPTGIKRSQNKNKHKENEKGKQQQQKEEREKNKRKQTLRPKSIISSLSVFHTICQQQYNWNPNLYSQSFQKTHEASKERKSHTHTCIHVYCESCEKDSDGTEEGDADVDDEDGGGGGADGGAVRSTHP